MLGSPITNFAPGHSKEAQILGRAVGKHCSADRSEDRPFGLAAPSRLRKQLACCQGCESVLCMFSCRPSEGDRRLAGSVETVPPAARRNRSVGSRRAGRVAKTRREEPVVDHLNCGASVAGSAARQSVTARRILKEMGLAVTRHQRSDVAIQSQFFTLWIASPRVQAPVQAPGIAMTNSRRGRAVASRPFLTWIARNPLKSPESDEGIQENPSPFSWSGSNWLWFGLEEFGPRRCGVGRSAPGAPLDASGRSPSRGDAVRSALGVTQF